MQKCVHFRDILLTIGKYAMLLHRPPNYKNPLFMKRLKEELQCKSKLRASGSTNMFDSSDFLYSNIPNGH